MPVAEGVDVQDVHVRRHDEEVLREGCEHVPRIQIHERCHKVESEGRCKSEEDDSGTTRGKETAGKFSCSVLEIYRCRFAPRQEGGDDEIHCQDDEIELDKAKDDERSYICPFGAGLSSAENFHGR